MNGSEISAQIELKKYNLADDIFEIQQLKNKVLQTCDIVCIYNKDSAQMLSVQKR